MSSREVNLLGLTGEGGVGEHARAMRVYLSNLGCKLNQAEVERLARQMTAAGHVIVPTLDAADLHVINSCTVTHGAARDSRKTVRRGTRMGVRTVVTGCWATDSPEEARGIEGVDLVVLNRDKESLVERLERSPLPARAAGAASATASMGEPAERPSMVPVSYVPLPAVHTRAAVKVEDGCNMRCSFCIIPSTRGPQRSRAAEEVVAEVEGLASAGLEEIVVTGVQISAYRDGERKLYDLVVALLESRARRVRFRLTSIAPWQFDRRLLDLFASDRLCRHFHLSLQSGCDATLRRMRRPYDSATFIELLEEIRSRVPGVAVTTDVIVGHPGETDEEFAASLDFVERCGFARVHAFPYSVRAGTEASRQPHPVAPEVQRERMSRMLEVATAGERRFWKQQLGASLEVLWENERGGRWRGMTDNYVRVFCDRPPAETRAPARLEALEERGVRVTHAASRSLAL